MFASVAPGISSCHTKSGMSSRVFSAPIQHTNKTSTDLNPYSSDPRASCITIDEATGQSPAASANYPRSVPATFHYGLHTSVELMGRHLDVPPVSTDEHVAETQEIESDEESDGSNSEVEVLAPTGNHRMSTPVQSQNPMVCALRGPRELI